MKKRQKRILSILLVLAASLALLCGNTLAIALVDSGTCGNNLTWTLDSYGTLTISGSGKMYDRGEAPLWPSERVKKVIIQSGVTSIGKEVFFHCDNLTTVSIPNSVTLISDYAFFACESLTGVSIPNSVTRINRSTFFGCSSLTSVSIPNSVTSIGNSAFGDCDSLVRISIPNSVTSIGDDAFWDCDNLTSVSIPNSVTSIGELAFFMCKSLTGVSIPNSVTSIGKKAFQHCDSLASVTIGSGLTSVANSNLTENRGTTAFYVNKKNPKLSAKDGVLFDKNMKRLIRYPMGKKAAKYQIPSSVTSIGKKAFYESDKLTSVSIPNTVTGIGDLAFYCCDNLTSVSALNSVTGNTPKKAASIGVAAFTGCHKLTSVSIPNSFTSIDGGAFSACGRLTKVTIPNSVTSIGATAFSGSNKLTTLRIPASVTKVGGGLFYSDSNVSKGNIYFRGNAPAFGTFKYYYDDGVYDDDYEGTSDDCGYYILKPFDYVSATVYYPAGNKTWTKKVRASAGGNITWKTWTKQKITAKSFKKVLGAKAFSLGAKTNGKGRLSYKSSAPKVATVSAAGKVTVKGVGKTTVTITAAESATHMAAKKKITVTVNPKGTALSGVTNVKGRKMKVRWVKRAGVTGYQIQYGTSKKFAKAKTVTVKGVNTTAKTITKLRKKTRYYVRVRTFKTVGKVQYRSAWSKGKSVVITR